MEYSTIQFETQYLQTRLFCQKCQIDIKHHIIHTQSIYRY